MRLKKKSLFARKQELARESGARYYGDGGTIHGTGMLDVMVDDVGVVRAVWFRCQKLPYLQHPARPDESPAGSACAITGVEVIDR